MLSGVQLRTRAGATSLRQAWCLGHGLAVTGGPVWRYSTRVWGGSGAAPPRGFSPSPRQSRGLVRRTSSRGGAAPQYTRTRRSDRRTRRSFQGCEQRTDGGGRCSEFMRWVGRRWWSSTGRVGPCMASRAGASRLKKMPWKRHMDDV